MSRLPCGEGMVVRVIKKGSKSKLREKKIQEHYVRNLGEGYFLISKAEIRYPQ